jgi:hypothetical protein
MEETSAFIIRVKLSEALVTLYQITWCHNLRDSNLNIHLSQTLKPHINGLVEQAGIVQYSFEVKEIEKVEGQLFPRGVVWAKWEDMNERRLENICEFDHQHDTFKETSPNATQMLAIFTDK